MKIVFKDLKDNIYNLMRQCGYHPEEKDNKTGQLVFARRLGTSGYPRFHIYVHPVKSDKVGARPVKLPPAKFNRAGQFNRVKFDKVSRETPNQPSLRSDGTGQAIINLHLDQKKPIYQRAPAHAAEYEGEIVEKEAERIKQIIGGL